MRGHLDDRSGSLQARKRKGGEYRLKAVVTDEKGRQSQTVTRVWVMGKEISRSKNLSQDAVDVIADKKTYAPGETAELLVVAPFAPADGMLVVARQGILSVERFRMKSGLQTVTLKIDDAMTPNVHAFVFLAGAAARENKAGEPDEKLPKRPAYAHGEADLSIPPASRMLTLAVKPRDGALPPGGRTTIDVDVTDVRGPVQGAEVAVVVVDESILALSGYTLPTPSPRSTRIAFPTLHTAGRASSSPWRRSRQPPLHATPPARPRRRRR